MSTKCSIVWGDNFHFYTDCFDDEHVFLSLQGGELEFEATSGEVVIGIPKSVWGAIKGCDLVAQDLVDLTDDQLLEKIGIVVDERIARNDDPESFMAAMGSMVYGLTTDPRDDQIKDGMEWHRGEREKQQRWRDEMATYKKR